MTTPRITLEVNFAWLEIDECLKQFKDAQDFDRKQQKIIIDKFIKSQSDSDAGGQSSVYSEKLKTLTDSIPDSPGKGGGVSGVSPAKK